MSHLLHHSKPTASNPAYLLSNRSMRRLANGDILQYTPVLDLSLASVMELEMHSFQHALVDNRNSRIHINATGVAPSSGHASDTNIAATVSERILRLPQVKSMVGLGTTSIYDKIKNGDFPKPIKIGRLSGWLESEIQTWISKQIFVSRS